MPIPFAPFSVARKVGVAGESLFHTKTKRPLDRKQKFVYLHALSDRINEQVDMFRHENKRGEPPTVVFDRPTDGDTELFPPPLVIKDRPAMITRKGQLVNFASFVEMFGTFPMRLGKWHTRIVTNS